MAEEKIKIEVSSTGKGASSTNFEAEARKLSDELSLLRQEAKDLAKVLNAKRTGYSLAALGRQAEQAQMRNTKGGIVSGTNVARLLGKGDLSVFDNYTVYDPKRQQNISGRQFFEEKRIEGGQIAQQYKANLAAQEVVVDKIKIVAQQAEVETNTKIEIPTAPETPVSQTLTTPEEQLGLDDIEIQTKAINKQTSSLGKAFKQFSLYAIILRTVKSAAREAVATIKELDKYLTEQAMVTGKTREQTYQLLGTYQQLAMQTGATTKEIAELATQFMRQGKTTEDALTLTRAAMDAAKVAGISATDSVNYLTTALNGFQMSAKDAMKVSDKFASIAANSATSYDEIATALSKVASQANLAGMSIDYTTALLAKGLETTREAPETMGTALKTIIARMREISDYGETLSGDTDINNVESQLAYVGIALKDMNGELRSTEDVLDDLGRKWDTLTSNQQAAVAKALAGTRQQSRLIAMMTDYERVIELQDIAERSQGATLAQMATYLDGMDAALNRVRIGWESIVTSLTDNEVIINIVNTFARFLEGMSNFLSTTAGSIVTFGTIAAISTIVVGNKMKEFILAQQQQQVEKRIAKQQRLENIALQEATLQAKQKLVADLQDLKAKSLATLQDKNASKAEKKAAQEVLNTIDQQILDAESQVKIEETKLNVLQQQDVYLTEQETLIGRIQSGISGLTAPLFLVITLWKTISGWIKIVSARQAAAHKQTMAEAAAENKAHAVNAAGKIISQLGWWGIAAAVGVAAALGVTGLAIAGAFNKPKQSVTEQINELSNEIYKLNEKTRALNSVTSAYEDLDNQIIKTQKDQEKMNELLDQAGDKLSEEEQRVYNALTTREQKLKYLQALQESSRQQANALRQEQLAKIRSMSSNEQTNVLSANTTDSAALTAQAAIYAINNNYLYEHIDALKQDAKYNDEQLRSIQRVTQALLEQLTPLQAYQYAQDPQKIYEMADALGSIKIGYENVAEILGSEDSGLVARVQAYRLALENLNEEQKALLQTVYADLDAFVGMDGTLLEWIEHSGISIQSINDLAKAIQKFGISSVESAERIKSLFTEVQSGTSISNAIQNTFADILSQFDKTTEDGYNDWLAAYNRILNAYSNAMGTGILNMGQNLQALRSTIDDFYEKAGKWSTMTASEQTDFITSNSELFKGKKGEELLQAIQSGDYQKIFNALSDQAGTLASRVRAQIEAIQTEIALENAKVEEERDYAYLKFLQDQLKQLQNTENLYSASLEVRLSQEQAYLNEYKNYLSSQKEALQKSLDQRKEAYQKYFDAVNKVAEDEDFETKESTLIANISKLSTSASADAVNKTATLEKELANLEKERIQTLRERAQAQITENIDKEVSEINDKFDKLLNSQSALLAAMTGELDNPIDFITNLISDKVQTEGLTQLGLEQYIKDLQSIYGSIIGDTLFDKIEAKQVGDQLVLNIEGQSVTVSSGDQQTIYEAIMNALKQVGLR